MEGRERPLVPVNNPSKPQPSRESRGVAVPALFFLPLFTSVVEEDFSEVRS
jgi:hypothetical protein